MISEYEDVEKEDLLSEQLGVFVVMLRTSNVEVFRNEFSEHMKLLGTVFEKKKRWHSL